MFVLFLCRPIVLLSLYITPKQQQRLKEFVKTNSYARHVKKSTVQCNIRPRFHGSTAKDVRVGVLLFTCWRLQCPSRLTFLYFKYLQFENQPALSRNDGIEEFTVDWEYLLMLLLYSKLLLLRMVFSAGQYMDALRFCGFTTSYSCLN